MIKDVESKTRLVIKGRVFALVWDDEEFSPSSCHRCGLFREVCNPSSAYNLLMLCDTLQAEPNTFFVERKEMNDL